MFEDKKESEERLFMKKVFIIGGVAGGASAAARLRRLDEEAEIVLFERGEFISFANCGLPYYIGGEIVDKHLLTLQTPQSFHNLFRVDVRIWSEVTSIDTKAKRVAVKNLQTGETYEDTYDFLVLSPGAAPIVPPIPGMAAAAAVENSRIFTLRNIPDTYRIKEFIEKTRPRQAVVLGGGFIGVEMAENLTRAGLSVTLLERANQVLGPLDYEMACEVHRHMRQKGVKLLLEKELKAVVADEEGLRLTLNEGSLRTDMLVVAVGVQPESGLAKSAGLRVSARGGIVVDTHMRTTDPHIYAVGDAVEVTDFVSKQKTLVPLAGPANKQGRIAADNICGIPSTYQDTQGSAIVKVFDLTVASTGLNEKTAQQLGLPFDKSFTYAQSHAGYYPGAVDMTLKTLFDTQTGKILGAQVVGFDGVDKRCDVLATAIRAGMTASQLSNLELCYAPPYSSAKDAVNIAAYVIENLLSGKLKHFHWHALEEVVKAGGVLVDVRTEAEYANAHLEGTLHIPAEKLRERMHELDKSKKIYVLCQVGLRGYVASRMLSQNGFDVYNLSGGWRLYNTVFGQKKEEAEPPPPLPGQAGGLQPSLPNITPALKINACGLQCPGPIVKLSESLKTMPAGDIVEISTTDVAFASDIEGYCRRTGHRFLGMHNSKGISTAHIQKTESNAAMTQKTSGNGKNFIVFSGDLDKAIASFVMANAAAALGRKTSMFFTFWGLNILRKPEKVAVKKDFMSKMLGRMMPRGSKKLQMSQMNMGGMGAKLIRSVMKNKNVDSLEELISMAQKSGVELVACAMSMDVMGIHAEELIDGVKLGGAAAMLAHAEESDMSLFI